MPAQVVGVQPHEHLCLIYRTDEEQVGAVASYFAEGLREGDRCIYLRDGPGDPPVFGKLAELGIDVAKARAEGALILLDAREAYLPDGVFDPDAMIALLQEAVRRTAADGFRALRSSGEMTWALAGAPGSERLIEYEAKLNQVLPHLNISGICQYDARRFDPEALRGVIETHPKVVYDGRVCTNAYYVPPDEFLRPGGTSQLVDRLLRNIVDRARAEEAVRELNDKLEQRVAERTRQLAAANADLESFAYTVSHDLRAPLRSIGFLADILASDEERLSPEGREHLDSIRGEARRSMRLVDDILALSRSNVQGGRVGPVDLSTLARSVVAELQASHPRRRIEVQTQPGVLVRGEGELLRIALQNLLGNAWKYTANEEKATVEFGAHRNDGEWACFVRDNGVGFDMSTAARLFEPFVRLHANGFEGSGVGLATVKRIVTRHGGSVWAESAPGQGTTIWFSLPAA